MGMDALQTQGTLPLMHAHRVPGRRHPHPLQEPTKAHSSSICASERQRL